MCLRRLRVSRGIDSGALPFGWDRRALLWRNEGTGRRFGLSVWLLFSGPTVSLFASDMGGNVSRVPLSKGLVDSVLSVVVTASLGLFGSDLREGVFGVPLRTEMVVSDCARSFSFIGMTRFFTRSLNVLRLTIVSSGLFVTEASSVPSSAF